jgi:hypothetical protein
MRCQMASLVGFSKEFRGCGGMVDAPDLKSVGPQGPWGFNSPHPHHGTQGGLRPYLRGRDGVLTFPAFSMRNPFTMLMTRSRAKA